MNEEKIKSNIEAIRKVMEMEVEDGDVHGMLHKLSGLVGISGLSAESVARAKAEYRECQMTVIEGIMEDPEQVKGLSASMTNDYVKAKCGRVEALYDYAERTDKKLSYAIEAVRSMISLYKSELENSLRESNTKMNQGLVAGGWK